MEWIIANWQNILFVFLLIITGAYAIMTNKVTKWLRSIVAEIEKELGSGTGQLKLAKAYEKFVERFPAFKTIVPFPLFAYWVDVALKWFEHQLETNTKVQAYIQGK